MEHVVTEPRPSHFTVRVEIVKEMGALARLREEWNRLFDEACNAAPPLHHDWINTWLDVYGQEYMVDQKALRIICCRHAGRLVGVVPLYLRRPLRVSDGGVHLGFISTGERLEDEICPDYMDVLCLEEYRQACANAVLQTISGELEESYDRAVLSDMADCSSLVQWARKHGARYDLEVVPRGVCPVSDLEGGMDAYLARLSHKTRAHCRRLLRTAEEQGVAFEVAQTPEEVAVFFNELVELHQQRWQSAGEKGCFDSQPFTSFHRQMCECWVPRNLAVLTRIRHGGRTVGVKYGFICRDKFHFYQSGICLEASTHLKSPGTLFLMLLIRYLIDQGIKTFDFLRGLASYKQRLATDAQPLVQVRRVRWTWRTGVGLAASLSTRAIGKARRMARRKKAVPMTEQEGET